jgi:hypothetical protein
VDTNRVHLDDHDDTLEAHYACLERPCACLEGWVFVGYIDEFGKEREASYPAAAARIAYSPTPIAYAATAGEGANRAPSGQGETNVCATDRAGVSFGVSRPFFLSTGNLAHLGDAVASLRWHDTGG